jgi:hypothetical protein
MAQCVTKTTLVVILIHSSSVSYHLLVAQAQELQQMCQSFLGDIEDFQKIADGFISIFDTVSKVYTFCFENSGQK